MINSDSFHILKKIDGTFAIYKHGQGDMITFNSLEEVFEFMKKWKKHVDLVVHPNMEESK